MAKRKKYHGDNNPRTMEKASILSKKSKEKNKKGKNNLVNKKTGDYKKIITDAVNDDSITPSQFDHMTD